MTQHIDFDGALINPDLVYRIDRVTDTVTFTLVMVGMGAGSIFSQDFVFGSEAEAITALAYYVEEAANGGPISRNELILAVTEGVLANSDITKGFEKTQGISVATRDARTTSFIVQLAEVIKAAADA